MDTLLAWLSQYSAPVVAFLALGAAGIYVLRNVMENAISAQFNKHTRQIELLLERRARFEEKILLDQYEVVKTLQAQIIGISTDINRYRNNHLVEGLFVGRDIPRLTEVYEQLAANRYLVKEDFYYLSSKQAGVVLRFAKAKDGTDLEQIGREYTGLQDEFRRLMDSVFGIDEISWSGSEA